MKRLAAAVGVSTLALLAGHVALAGGVTYAVAGTKACLARKGTQFESPNTGVLADMTPRQRAESLVGVLPGGNAPTFLYLAIGHDRTDALAVRGVLKKSIAFPQNAWSDVKANAAWIVVSIVGEAPSSRIRTLVLSCLTKGAPPSGRAPVVSHYVESDVALCMQKNGRAAILSATDIATTAKLLLGRAIPARFVPHLLFGFTSTTAQTKDGLRVFALFGKSHSDALLLRAQLDKALGGKVLGPAIWTGSKKNVAWAASKIRGTTPAGIASGKQTLLSCLP